MVYSLLTMIRFVSRLKTCSCRACLSALGVATGLSSSANRVICNASVAAISTEEVASPLITDAAEKSLGNN
jgi:hypothetical protein